MANPADEFSSADLKALAYGGAIREDVMSEIWDITRIPLPFSDMIGSDPVGNSYAEWSIDALADSDVTNAVIDGADITQNDAAGATRVGNQCQISVKRVSVTERAQGSDVIGGNTLTRNVVRRQQELKRDQESIMLYNQASVADNGDDTAGKLGGLPAWLTTNTDRGGGAGADSGFSSGVVAAATPGTARQASEATLRTLIATAWEGGAELTDMMGMPVVIRGLSQYLLSSTAKVATLTSDAGQSVEEMVAKGSVNVFLTDHGQVLTMRANRLQKVSTGTQSDLLLLDPSFVRKGVLNGMRIEPLAKTGLADKRLMAEDYTLKVLNEASFAVYADIDNAQAWAA